MRIFSIILTIILSVSFFFYTKKAPRLQESGVNTQFNFDTSKPFKEYIKYSREVIESGRIDLNASNKDKIISWNSPFILQPASNCSDQTKKGILLVHGLTDSPFTSREIAQHFNNNCFTVYTILLAGHGTRPGDLTKVSYKDWIKQVNYGVKELKKKADEIHLGGYSTGAALVVDYLLSNPDTEIESVILLSPALILDKLAILAPILKYVKPYDSIQEDKDVVKYESFAINATTQIYRLTKRIQKKLKSKNHPLENTKVFAALAYDDETVSGPKTLEFLLNNTNPDKRHIILYHQDELPKDLANNKNLFPKKSLVKKDRILNLAHISIPNSSKNIWYGKGKYRNCAHYYKSARNYDMCKSANNIFYGENSEKNLENNIVARLTYNPFIKKMFFDLSQFLEL